MVVRAMRRPIDVLVLVASPRRSPSLCRGCVSFSPAGGRCSACRFYTFGENDHAETEDVVHVRGALILPEHLRKALTTSSERAEQTAAGEAAAACDEK